MPMIESQYGNNASLYLENNTSIVSIAIPWT